MDENFLAAYIPETFTVLGKRLEPFSIEHGLWLQRLDCDPVDTYEKLITAVLVCSRPVDDIRATLDDSWLRLKLWVWARRLGSYGRSPLGIQSAAELFWRYIAHYSQKPGVFSQEESAGLPGAPWLQHVRVTLIKHGWPPAYVASMPYCLALWDYYTLWENDGRLEIANEEHYRIRDESNERHNEIAKAAAEILRKGRN
jgi:hypothetical protein